MTSRLIDRARQLYEAEGRLFYVHLDVLYQCDLDCTHCYLDAKSVPLRPTSFWLDVIDQVADAQAMTVLFSGGEIFLRPDVFELIARARARGLYVLLKSHGGHLREDFVERLVELGVTQVSLSYYSTQPSIHDAITRRPGSHARTLDALRRLASSPVLVEAVYLALRPNRHCYRDVVAQCEALGAGYKLAGYLRLAQTGARFPQALALEPSELEEFYAFCAAHAGEADCGDDRPAALWGEQKNCIAGHSALYVDPTGKVSPCVNWPMPVADLAAGDRLAEIHRSNPQIRAIQATRKADRAGCTDCGARESCFYCPGQAYQESGDANRPALPLCENGFAKASGEAASRGLAAPRRPALLERPRFTILRALPPARAAQP